MVSATVRSVKELRKLSETILSEFSEQRVFAFFGKMGAGKTTFIQAFCETLGSGDIVTSPTFALINEYRAPRFPAIFHFDFYRIKNVEEAFDLGYEDYFFSGDYCLIEWPEKIESLLPEKYVEVKIEVQEDDSRIISAKTT